MKLLSEIFDKTKRKDVTRLQDILVYLGGTIADSTDDIKTRSFGTHTANALKAVKKKIALPQTAGLNKSTINALNRKAIEKYYSTKTQTAKLHHTLTKIARIAKLEYDLSEDIKARKQGRQTRHALRMFQKKYGLKQTGRLKQETLERIESVAASQIKPFKKLKVPQTERLMKVRNEFLQIDTFSGHSVVPITLTLDSDKSGMVISGPNMGGKSTYYRKKRFA